MKKILLVAFLLIFAIGCANADREPVGNPVDPSIWGYDSNENQVNGSLAILRTTTEAENGLYFVVNVISGKEGGSDTTYVVGYVDKSTGSFSIVDSSGSAQCSLDSPKSCTSFIEGTPHNLNYYNGHLYFVRTVVDNDSGQNVDYLVQMDLDGNNQQNVAMLKTSSSNSNSTFSIIFHRGMIYYSYGDFKISQIDMSTWEISEPIIFDNTTALSIFKAEAERIYFTSTVYIDGETRLVDAVLSSNLDGSNIELIQSEMQLFQSKDDIFVSFNPLTFGVEYTNVTTSETKVLRDEIGIGSVIFQKDYFILHDYSDSPEDVLVFDLDGNLLSSFTQTKGLTLSTTAQVVTEGYYYTYLYYADRTAFVRIPIVDNVLGEIEVIAEWEGSSYGG